MHQNHLEGFLNHRLMGFTWGFWFTCCGCLVAKSCLTCDPMDCRPKAPLSMGFPRQEDWNGLSFPPPGDLLTQRLNSHFLHWYVDSLPLSYQGSPWFSRFGVSKVCSFAFLVQFPGYADTAVIRNHSVWTIGLIQPESKAHEIWGCLTQQLHCIRTVVQLLCESLGFLLMIPRWLPIASSNVSSDNNI